MCAILLAKQKSFIFCAFLFAIFFVCYIIYVCSINAAMLQKGLAMSLTNQEILSLARAVTRKAADAARSAVSVGDHPVDLLVQIDGVLSVGQDYDRAPTGQIPWRVLFFLLLKRAGITRESAIAMIAEDLPVAFALSEDSAKALIAEYDLDAIMRRVKSDIVDKLPRQRVRGSVKFAGQIKKI